ncbi:MAG: hypothetical protein GF368_02965 [Candidatus Aenigmarchaeota archaeon]|nr:hypothetical protein [Candidatus Aenigmarchaeota archaeon]
MIRKFLILNLFLLLLIPVLTFSEDVKVLSPDSAMVVYAGETNELKVPVKNEGDTRDTVYISIWPTQWVSLEKYWLNLDPGESRLISIFIAPPEEAESGTMVFTLTAQSLNTNRTSTDSLFVDIKRKSNIFISEVTLNKERLDPGESLEINSILTNLHKNEKKRVFLETRIISEGRSIEKFEETIDLEPKTVKTVKNFYEIDKLQEYGEYQVEVELKDNLKNLLDKEMEEFEIEENFEIVKHESKEYGVFYTSTIIEISNNGNVPNSNYTVQESLPKITKYFFYPEIEPSTEQEKDNRVLYTWEIQNLDPGQTKVVRYRLRFVNIFVAVLIFLILIILTYEYLTQPILRKKYFGDLAGDEELKITLHVTNKKKRTLKDIVVKDKVPPIAKVVKKFDTRKPEIEVKSSGTQLKWKIEKLKPGEEILLTYKVKPLIDVIGKLKLPKSYLTYKGKVKRNRKVVSKSVSITGKVK